MSAAAAAAVRAARLRTFHASLEHGAELVKGPYVAESFEVRVEEDYIVIEV